MSELNRALLSVYRLGADHRTLKTLATPAAHRIHSYLLRVAVDSPNTYTTLDEVKELLSIPNSTAWRVMQSLTRLSLLEHRRSKPQRKDGVHGAGGSGKNEWRARL